MQILMKQLAATLSRQRGIQYEFGPEFKEYSEKKAAGTLGESHLKPLSEVFTEEQLSSIPVDNKAGENYFEHLSQQLKSILSTCPNSSKVKVVPLLLPLVTD